MNITNFIYKIEDAIRLREQISKLIDETKAEIKCLIDDNDVEFNWYDYQLELEVLLTKQKILYKHYDEILDLYPTTINEINNKVICIDFLDIVKNNQTEEID